MTNYYENDYEIYRNPENDEDYIPVKVLFDIDYEWQEAEPDVGIMSSGFIVHSVTVDKALNLKDGSPISVDIDELWFEGDDITEEDLKQEVEQMLLGERESSMEEAAVDRWLAQQEAF